MPVSVCRNPVISALGLRSQNSRSWRSSDCSPKRVRPLRARDWSPDVEVHNSLRVAVNCRGRRSWHICPSVFLEVFAKNCGKALIGRPIEWPHASKIHRPSRAEISRFQRLFRQACHIAETRRKLIERPEVARALEQEMLHAIVNCLVAAEADDDTRTRHHHAAVMIRFEEALRGPFPPERNPPVDDKLVACDETRFVARQPQRRLSNVDRSACPWDCLHREPVYAGKGGTTRMTASAHLVISLRCGFWSAIGGA
jgi:hypothetical protein